jgi:hypothetical protein
VFVAINQTTVLTTVGSHQKGHRTDVSNKSKPSHYVIYVVATTGVLASTPKYYVITSATVVRRNT